MLKKECFNKILKVFGDVFWNNKSCDNFFENINLNNKEIDKIIVNSSLIGSKLFDVYKNINFKVAEKSLSYSSLNNVRREGFGINIFSGIVLEFELENLVNILRWF